jgi:integrase
MVQRRKSNLKSRSWRLEQPIRKKPYFETIVYGVLLGYRRTKDNGTWLVRVTRDGSDWTKAFAKADDHDKPDGKVIFDYEQAEDEAKKLAKAGKPASDNTVATALDRYETDLKDRGGDVRSVSRARLRMSPRLAQKAVGSLAKEDLTTWRDSLKGKMKPASVNRTITALRAALNLAAEDADGRITNREAWRSGLKAISGAGKARNVILDEADVRVVISAAYQDSKEFGLLVELAAVTGARPSQLLRLQGEDVQAGFTDPKSKKRQPRLMMPVSRKGRGEKKIVKRPVPIPEYLANRLIGRTGTLLLRPDGEPWTKTNLPRHFEGVMKGARFSQPKVTIYALRHTSIVRQLLAGVPIRIVAALHDTSVKMIEQNYSEHIADHADELARPTLLETMAEVIALPPPSTKARSKKGVPEVPG